MKKIKVINGYKEYIKNKEKIKILENINIEFEEGKLYGILGNSGCGKTTLLNILGTLDKFTQGEVLIDGENIGILDDNEKSVIRMKKIGFIFQAFYLNNNMNVIENILQPMYINKKFNKKSMKKRADELINIMGLEKRKKHYPKELSGGEQQRVAIARALANNPDIILADEPTGNLDSNNTIKIFEILRQLANQGKCVIIVSHSDIIKEYADEIYQINKGTIIKYGY